MNSKVYKWCAVPQCKNTSISRPNKLFVYVPNKKNVRNQWLKLARRNPEDVVATSSIYFCEDHFDSSLSISLNHFQLPNDMENYMQYHLMGSVSQVRMKPGCIPHKFECQPDRKTRSSTEAEQPYICKKRKMMLLEECEKQLKESSMVTEHSEDIASTSSDGSDNNCNSIESVPSMSQVKDKNITQQLKEMDSKAHGVNNEESEDKKIKTKCIACAVYNRTILQNEITMFSTGKKIFNKQVRIRWPCVNNVPGYYYKR